MVDKHTPKPAITSNDAYSNYNQQEITGLGQAGSTIYLYDNNSYVGQSTVGADGTWNDNVSLLTGANAVVGYDYNSSGLEGTTNTYSSYVSPLPSYLTGPNLSFDSNIKGGSGTAATLSGTVSDPDGIYDNAVFLYSDGAYIGAASVNTNGTWSYKFNQGAGDFTDITATAYDSYFNASSASSDYELITGIQGEPYKTEQITYSPDGTVTNAAFYKSNGKLGYSATYTYDTAGDTSGVLTGSGGSITFASDSGDKKDSIVNFITGGASHDTLNLSETGITNMHQLLSHSSTSGGNTTIHLDSYSSITLDGVSKTQLQTHPGDFKFA